MTLLALASDFAVACHHTSMYLLCLDDSGKHTSPYLTVGGLAVHEQDARRLSTAVDAILRSVLEVRSDAELHTDHVRWGRTHWRGVPHSERQRVLVEVAELLAAGVSGQKRRPVLFATALHTASNRHHNPYERVHEETFGRCNGFIGRETTQGDPHRCIALLDRSPGLEHNLQNLMRRWKEHGSTTGAAIGPMQAYVEVPLFVDSRQSRLIQLADFVANTVNRFYTRQDETLFKIIPPAFYSLDGTIHGLTHLVAGHRTCPCPACGSR